MALLAAMSACDDSELSIEEQMGDISFSTAFSSVNASTKALIEGEDINKSGTEVKVCGFAGGIAIKTGDESASMAPESAVCGNDKKWTLGHTYKWKYQQDHLFYGWLDTYSGVTAGSFFSDGFNYSTSDRKITISPKTLPISDSHFDFAYSDVVVRNTAQADYSTVVLPMRHLFTSFSLAAHNYNTQSITITSVRLYGIKNRKGAEITFGSSATSVTLTNAATAFGSDPYVELLSASVTLDPDGHKASIVNGASDTRKYFLMWPQTEAELCASSSSTTEFIPTGTDQPYIEVWYTIGSENNIYKARLPYDEDNGWAAGVRHNMELSFKPKKISLTMSAMPWNQTTPEIDFEGTVMVQDGLHVDNSSCIIDNDNRRVYFKGGNPIKAYFKIDQPLNASWIVGKEGDFDAFEIDNITEGSDSGILGDGIDTNQGVIDAEYAYIAITPKVTNPQKDYSIQLTFVVRGNNGVVSNIDETMQGADKTAWYTFILSK